MTNSIEVGGWSFDVPTMLLIIMFALILWIMLRAHRSGLNWAEAFKDDSGKPSFLRLAVLIALSITGWQIMSLTLRVQPTVDLLERLTEFFIVVFSGAKIAEKALDVILAKFGLRPAPPAPPA